MKRKSAFTLVELLVVLGIIAVLAAILFPVFASVRESARTTSCLSNIKQWSAAEILYTQDYDENVTPCWTVNSGPLSTWIHNPLTNQNFGIINWCTLVQPYIKNAQIAVCPDDGFTQQFTSSSMQLLYADYGINESYLSIYLGPDPNLLGLKFYDYAGVTLAQINRPTQTVMLADSQGYNWASKTNNKTFNIPGGPIVGPPSFWDTPIYYNTYNSWGYGWGKWNAGDSYTALFNYPGYNGMSFRHRSNAVTSFVDGHAKALSASQLSIGTNFNPNQDEIQTHVINFEDYLWSLN